LVTSLKQLQATPAVIPTVEDKVETVTTNQSLSDVRPAVEAVSAVESVTTSVNAS